MASNVMCRLCAKSTTSSDVIFLFSNDPDCIQWREKIKKYTPIKLEVKPDKRLPQDMCLQCSKKLDACNMFWQQCELANKAILAKLDEKQESKQFEENEKTPVKPKRGSCYCVAKWCNSNNLTCSYMFRIPKGNRGKEWLKQADRPDLLDIDEAKLNRKYLCDKHFTKECFLKNNMLTRNAVPTIFDECSKFLTKSRPENTVQPEVVKKLHCVQKLRPLLPAPAKQIKEDVNLLKEVSSRCITSPNNTDLQFMSATNPVQASSSNTFGDKMDQYLVLNQSNDNILIVVPSEVDLVGLQKKTPDLKCDKRTITSVENSEQNLNEFNKNMSNKKVKVDGIIEAIDDIESLVSGQTYKESMLPCSGCGEVFLMSSSLIQHKQRYHGEHFDNNLST